MIFSISVYWPWGQNKWRPVIVAKWMSWVGGGGHIDERDSDRCKRRGEKSCTMHTYITFTSRIDFAIPLRLIRRCGDVNQNGNENLCNSNWIYADEGHFIGPEAGPNSPNEDWFCDSFSPFSESLSRRPPRPPRTHAHTYLLQWFLLYFLEHTSSVWHPNRGCSLKPKRLTKTASGIMCGVLRLYK